MDATGGHGVTSGHLSRGSLAPRTGEEAVVLSRASGFLVEQILSGSLDAPVDYREPHDEWVVVLEGSAVLEIGAERRELAPGDWLMLPANTPHRLVHTEAGTSWLTVTSAARNDC